MFEKMLDNSLNIVLTFFGRRGIHLGVIVEIFYIFAGL